MAIPREFLSHLAAEMAKRLEKSGKIKFPDQAAAAARVQQVFQDDAAREDQLNQEVRDYLTKHAEEMRRDNISYQDFYQMVKRELMKKYKMVHAGGRDRDEGKLSRDKIIEMSHALVKNLATLPHAEFVQQKNDVRLEIFSELQALLREEASIDRAARQKIQSQKKEIVEGSGEWDILFRKYYSEEMRKLGVS
jgi:hypothetical protein